MPLPNPDSVEGALACTEWRLGNAREASGFLMSVRFSVAGTDGGVRKVVFTDTNTAAQPKEHRFELQGFTAPEFLQARAAGRRRFINDDTANVAAARDNVDALLKLGARAAARVRLEEALSKAGASSSRWFVQGLQRQAVELADDPVARRLAEGVALLGNPTARGSSSGW